MTKNEIEASHLGTWRPIRRLICLHTCRPNMRHEKHEHPRDIMYIYYNYECSSQFMQTLISFMRLPS